MKIITFMVAVLILSGPSVVPAQDNGFVGPGCPKDPEELQRVCGPGSRFVLPFPDCCPANKDQNNDDPNDNQINPRILKTLERLVNEKFEHAILMTDQDCKSFGNEWEPYAPISGRFPLASGQGSDNREEMMDFPVRTSRRGV